MCAIVVLRADRIERHAAVDQPVEGLGRMFHCEAHDLWVGRVVADAHDIVIVLLHRVGDVLALLQLGACSTHVAAGNVQRAANIGRAFQ